MKYYIYILILVILSSCIDEKSLKPIVPGSLFHANSAKTWLLDKEIFNNRDVTPKIASNKMSLTFFSDGEFYQQKLMHLGTDKGIKGTFYLQIIDSDTLFYLDYKDSDKLKFNVHYLTEKNIQLSTLNDSLKWVLISYPKPF